MKKLFNNFYLFDLALIFAALFSLQSLLIVKKVYQCSLFVLTLSVAYNLLSVRRYSFFSNLFLIIAAIFCYFFVNNSALCIGGVVVNVSTFSLAASVLSLLLSGLICNIFIGGSYISYSVENILKMVCFRTTICLGLDSIIMWTMLLCFTKVTINNVLSVVLLETFVRLFLSTSLFILYKSFTFYKSKYIDCNN